ncbi:hypothetical protein H0H93_006618 [Arthromyces matolae]|nr:hypothetical protein H0H93_006618 [Arthromyces matolae]
MTSRAWPRTPSVTGVHRSLRIVLLPGGMTTLNEDVLKEIFSWVHETSFQTLKVLLLANHAFYSISLPYLYRNLAINIEGADVVDEIGSLLDDPSYSSVATSVHKLRIEDVNPRDCSDIRRRRQGKTLGTKERDLDQLAGSQKTFDWTIISALIARTTSLRSVIFACRFSVLPPTILQSIDNYPSILSLHITSWGRSSLAADHTDPDELALASTITLRSFQSLIYNSRRSPIDLRIPAVARIARCSPRLETFSLDLRTGGCVQVIDGHDAIMEQKGLWDKFDAIMPDTRPYGIRNLKLHDVDLQTVNLGDLSHVSTLDYGGKLSVDVIRSLPALVNVTMRGDFGNINSILLACSPLHSLRIVKWKRDLSLGVLGTHHPSLKSLSLHEMETSDVSEPRPTLQQDQLLRLASQNSRLQMLSIDVNFPEDQVDQDFVTTNNRLTVNPHVGIYSTFRSFRKLRKLHLNFNLGVATYKNGPGLDTGIPRATSNFAREVWEEVNGYRSPSETLVELRISQGEACRRMGYGRPASWVGWENRSHHWFLVTRDGDNGDGRGLSITNHRDIPDFEHDLWRQYDA